ncbi:MAG: hypothetical protein MUF76_13445 [Hydrogenophaga sp.]|jgi:hypothetical protein|nr:hypothetical protein [Hydrogenophaga sp.]
MAFVTEKIPQSFLDSFDPGKLYAPYSWSRWKTDTWTYDKERDVAWISITTDSNVAADEQRPAFTWYTMILEGHVVGVLAEDGGEVLPGFDEKFNRPHESVTLEHANFQVPDVLDGREREIVKLAEEALFHSMRYPSPRHERTYIVRAEIRGVTINGRRLETSP